MTAPTPQQRREHLRTDPDALPDPRLWTRPRSPFAGPVRRIALLGAAVVVALAASGWALRTVFSRARQAAVGAPLGVLERLAPLAVEGEREAPGKRTLTPEEIAELNRSWVGSETIAPRDATVDRATAERVAPFHGFGVDVETAPLGARVAVNGVEVGTSPIVASVRCDLGDAVEVRAERGRKTGRAVTRCRKDALVSVKIALQ